MAIDEYGADWRRSAPGGLMVPLRGEYPAKHRLAAEIRPNFLHVAGAVALRATRLEIGRPSAMKAYARDRFNGSERQRWQDDQQQNCKIGDMLPDDSVVEAMFTGWYDHRSSRCQSLEQFIGRSLTRSRAGEYQWRILHGVLPDIDESEVLWE